MFYHYAADRYTEIRFLRMRKPQSPLSGETLRGRKMSILQN